MPPSAYNAANAPEKLRSTSANSSACRARSAEARGQIPAVRGSGRLTRSRAIAPIVPPETSLLATGGEIDSFAKWNGALLDKSGRELRYITTHLVADLEHTLDRNKDHNATV